ncbi:uncharacterized protein [Haliotis cracherodii]|uniref:uncharacterized protein n=1 Tax=Haliotis cracherodii TaxID=6455 RepID=UPI0039E9E9C5
MSTIRLRGFTHLHIFLVLYLLCYSWSLFSVIMEFKEDELEPVANLFRKLGMEPKDQSPEDLKAWIQGMAQQAGPLIEEEPSLHGQSVPPPGVEGKAQAVAYHQFPKLPLFSGDETGKDAPFDLWTYEVDCLFQSKCYTSDVIDQAVRRSLKGEAARVAMRLGSTASTKDLLSKLQSIYGTVRRRETLMAQLYSATQTEDEDVASWGCRLEHLLSQITEHHTIPMKEQDEMLRNMFWSGLKPTMKAISGHKFGSLASFDELRISLRELEYDMKRGLSKSETKKCNVSAKMAIPVEPVSKNDLETLTSTIDQLRVEVSDIRKRQDTAQLYQHQTFQARQDMSFGSNRRGKGHAREYPPHPAPSGNNVHTRNTYAGNEQRDESTSAAYHSGSYGDRRFQTRYEDRSSPKDYPSYAKDSRVGQGRTKSTGAYSTPPYWDQEDYQEPICYRCGYPGHIASGCRVRLDHLRRPLNWQGPMGRGHH